MSLTQKYEAVIGLEVHARLSTATKLFCSCRTMFGAEPNSCVCPVCLGLPGTLPSLNSEAIRLAALTGLATNCQISKVSSFDRKNYFYPDLPKAYQITQARYPLCRNGYLDVNGKRIRIKQIHVEEDAGKLIHHSQKGTLIDYNRCGTPLVEIVTLPDLGSADDARAFLTELRSVLLYAGLSDCKMNEGSLRCDVNISVRKNGEDRLGVKTEIKNINSISFVGKAIEYELARQAKILDRGGEILPETRRFDESTGKTYGMRVKEAAEDYRYVPEPDLPPFSLSDEYVNALKDSLPMMPAERRAKYTDEYGLSSKDAEILVSRPPVALYFESVTGLTEYPKIVANVIISNLLSEADTESFDVSVTPEELAEIVTLYGDGIINSSTVKTLISMTPDSDLSPAELVAKHGLAQINDKDVLRSALLRVIKEAPKLLDDYKNGKLAAKKAIVGKVMAATRGRANPVLLDEIFGQVTK